MHFSLQAAHNGIGVTIQKIAQVCDQLAVALLINGANAGAGTQLDVVIQAGTRVFAGDLAVTGKVREDMTQHIQGLMHCPDAGIGAKVMRAVFDHLARHRHFGERCCHVDFDVRVAFIILEADVEAWPVLLDEVHLQDERFKL
ncbi:hypothetical protein SDC9_145663 [bioreactor metagenome]|uniref:Uncharacterized protein n=1 Tax=bioreactor metagenome TaxID=1076179 RepID=A0A645EAJ3_9ZZZZ